jgi:poly [ADP-ribose] polymerase 10/14/15
VGGASIVVATKLDGFSPATFTLGPQFAYRGAIAAEAGTVVEKVIISNIRAAHRRLREGRRTLANAAVDFDTTIAVANAGAAPAMATTVAAITPTTIKIKFVAELKSAKASGAFNDMAGVSVIAVAAGIEVTNQQPMQATVTGAPTPSPTPPTPSPTPVMHVSASLALRGYSGATFDAVARSALHDELTVWLTNTTRTIEIEVGVGRASGTSWVVPIYVTTASTQDAFRVQASLGAIANNAVANAAFTYGFRARIGGHAPLNFGITIRAIMINKFAEASISKREFCRQFATSHELAAPCCQSLPGCYSALSLVGALEEAEVLVIADITIEALAILLCVVMMAFVCRRGKENKERWIMCHRLLLLLALVDAYFSLTVKNALASRDAEGLLEQLYDSECFSRAEDKSIFTAQETIENYVGTIIVVQVAFALLGAVFHAAAASDTDLFQRDQAAPQVGLQCCTRKEYLSLAGSFFCEVIELVMAVVGTYDFYSAKDTFAATYSTMAGTEDARSGGTCGASSSRASGGTGASTAALCNVFAAGAALLAARCAATKISKAQGGQLRLSPGAIIAAATLTVAAAVAAAAASGWESASTTALYFVVGSFTGALAVLGALLRLKKKAKVQGQTPSAGNDEGNQAVLPMNRQRSDEAPVAGRQEQQHTIGALPLHRGVQGGRAGPASKPPQNPLHGDEGGAPHGLRTPSGRTAQPNPLILRQVSDDRRLAVKVRLDELSDKARQLQQNMEQQVKINQRLEAKVRQNERREALRVRAAGRYEWLDEHGAWNPYPLEVNRKILTADKSAATCSFDRGDQSYNVTTRFPMFQTNVTCKTNQHVRFAGGPADEKYFRETPKYWRPGTTPTIVELVELDRLNPDMKAAWDDVVALVTRECALNVLSVSVLQAPARWMAYNMKKAHLEAKLAASGGANEQRVFHGGAEASIRGISRQGFIREYNHASKYGKGTYFARDMSYSASDRYSPPNANGEKFAFLARVLVGEPCVGSSEMTMPSPKPDGSGLLHDSMVNRLQDPSIFVLSSGSDEHAYPEFMVRFKRN